MSCIFSSNGMISKWWDICPVSSPTSVDSFSSCLQLGRGKYDQNFLIETNWVLCYHSFFSIFPMNLLSCGFTKPDHRAVSALEKGQLPPRSFWLGPVWRHFITSFVCVSSRTYWTAASVCKPGSFVVGCTFARHDLLGCCNCSFRRVEVVFLHVEGISPSTQISQLIGNLSSLFPT